VVVVQLDTVAYVTLAARMAIDRGQLLKVTVQPGDGVIQ
jgi:hypothetical protein